MLISVALLTVIVISHQRIFILGVNYIDTAPWYGHGKSESVLGEVLKDIPRSSYYISTKVGR